MYICILYEISDMFPPIAGMITAINIIKTNYSVFCVFLNVGRR